MPSIAFNMQQQEHSDWCWAAVAASVERYFAPNSTWCQRRLASQMAKIEKLKVTNCGTCKKRKPISQKCNRTWFLDKALELVGRLKGKAKAIVLSFAQVERRIRDGVPVCVRILWGKGPAAHFVVISGCETAPSGAQWVDIEDPFAGSSTWLYEEFRLNYQYSEGAWVATYPVKGNSDEPD